MKQKTTLLIALMSGITFCTSAQSFDFFAPLGDEVHAMRFGRRVIDTTTEDLKTFILMMNSGHISFADLDLITSATPYKVKIVYTPPRGVDIVNVNKKLASSNAFLMLLSNLKVDQLKLTSQLSQIIGYGSVNEPLANAKSVCGDDVYMLTGKSVWVTRDSGASWEIDTTGLNLVGFDYLNTMDIDQDQNVWLAANDAVYMQPLVSDIWTKITSAPANPRTIFADRQNRIWVAKYGSLKLSTDAGASWNNAPSGIPSLAEVIAICDDAFGNIYAITGSFFDQTGEAVYRSIGGTQSFTKIDDAIQDLLLQNDNKEIYNSISGDTVLMLATDVGAFYSSDQGDTWQETSGMRSSQLYSIVSTSNNRIVASTNLAAFYIEDGDTVWHKSLPESGFTGQQQLFRDNAGTIYSAGQLIYNSTTNDPIRMVVKSSDNGTTWQPDTAGIHSIVMNSFYVDETGTQHAAGSLFIPYFGYTTIAWAKPPGQPWVMDSAGINGQGFPNNIVFGSGNNGYIYLAVQTSSCTLFKRPITGGAWTVDANFGSSAPFEISGNGNKLVAATTLGISQYDGSTWQPVSNPVNYPNAIPFSVQAASNGLVWAYFEDFDIIANVSLGRGLWYTTDFTAWHEAPGNIDTVIFKRIIAIGDSVFALSRGFNGVWVFDTTSNTVSVEPVEASKEDMLHVQPNPFASQTEFIFSVLSAGHVTLEIWNISGRKLCTIADDYLPAGTYRQVFEASKLPSGMYFYLLTTTDANEKGKLVVER